MSLVQRKFHPADESEVARIAEWWMTKNDRNYARAMEAGGVDEVIQQVWMRLLKNPPPTEWKLTTIVVKAVEWAIFELHGRNENVKFNQGVFLRAVELHEVHHPVALTSPTETLEREELRTRVGEVLRCLPYRSCEVIRHRYGLDGQPPKTLKEVSEIFLVTGTRVRQIEQKALKKLQHHSLSKQLLPFTEFLLEDEEDECH
jgi:RNA polymerase sigma factor (sigma-70 family)